MEELKNIKELMIGDYVYIIDDFNDTEKICKICALKDNEVEQIWKHTNDNNWLQIEEAYPIPLTTEILLNNGFENISEVNYDFTCIYNEYCISYFPRRYKLMINNINYDCQYVHQMQNIFNILGIDKEIIL